MSTIICGVCKVEFTPRPQTRNPKYCITCSIEGRRLNRAKIHEPRVCLFCQTTFIPKNDRNIYCARLTCQDKSRNFRAKKILPPKPCSICNKVFTPVEARNVYCGSECQTKGRRNRAIRVKKKVVRLGYKSSARLCVVCEKPIILSGMCYECAKPNNRYISPAIWRFEGGADVENTWKGYNGKK